MRRSPGAEPISSVPECWWGSPCRCTASLPHSAYWALCHRLQSRPSTLSSVALGLKFYKLYFLLVPWLHFSFCQLMPGRDCKRAVGHGTVGLPGLFPDAVRIITARTCIQQHQLGLAEIGSRFQCLPPISAPTSRSSKKLTPVVLFRDLNPVSWSPFSDIPSSKKSNSSLLTSVLEGLVSLPSLCSPKFYLLFNIC